MDHWPESPLNKAHLYDRKATALVKKFGFDEAIECHLLAAQSLSESINLTDNEKAKQSIELQKEYHLKQKDFLRLKKTQYHAYKEALRVQKEAMSRVMKVRGGTGKQSGSETEGVTLQKAIYRTIEEADSLLELLVHREEGERFDNDTNQETKTESLNQTINLGSKQPKDDHTVIEELRIVNYQLRSLITELMSQLTASEKEVTTLKQRISELEVENKKLKPESIAASAYSSPFVFSPADELAPEVTSELPVLAPLEMPNFDLSVLHKKFQSSDS